MLLTAPPPVTNCHTFSDPLPLERDVLYGRPLIEKLAAIGHSNEEVPALVKIT